MKFFYAIILYRIFSRRMMFSMRRVLFFFLFLSLMLSLPSFAKRFTQGFRLAKLRLDFPYHPEWETDPNPAIQSILEQKYSFIGKGAQSYVFESEDGKYVIKLFRYDQPSSETKIIHLFNACKMAYDSLRDETGLVYVHLNPTPMNLPTLQCKDPIGRNYKFALDHYRFALQKKATPFRQTLIAAQSDPLLMQKRIDQFIALLKARTNKEILNTDSNLSRNFGFLEDRSIEFDFGNYRRCPGLNRKNEIRRYALKLRRWLKRHAPHWVSYLDEQLKEIE
jgi:hypothetical protein